MEPLPAGCPALIVLGAVTLFCIVVYTTLRSRGSAAGTREATGEEIVLQAAAGAFVVRDLR